MISLSSLTADSARAASCPAVPLSLGRPPPAPGQHSAGSAPHLHSPLLSMLWIVMTTRVRGMLCRHRRQDGNTARMR